MNNKQILVSFATIAIALFLVATVAAVSEFPITSPWNAVRINDIAAGRNVAVTAGEDVTVDFTFTSLVNATDVEVKAEIEGHKVDVTEVSKTFVVEAGHGYRKSLILTIPESLKDDLSEELTLTITLSGEDTDSGERYKTEIETDLSVQRDAYKASIKSIGVPQTVQAGESLPVDFVLKNIGYNDLDDLYVTVSIPALNLQREGYFGDLVADENAPENDDDEDNTDTVSGRVMLQMPEDAKSGIYTVEVSVSNDDTTANAVKQITVKNELSGNNVIATVTGRSVAVGENAEYSILIVNPTNKLKVYRIVPEASGDLSVSVDQSVVAIGAGSSEVVKVIASSAKEGAYTFNVDVLSGEELVQKVTLNANVQGQASKTASPIVVLTIVLAVIFVVLLIVLVVLLGRKPEKSEEFGESYY